MSFARQSFSAQARLWVKTTRKRADRLLRMLAVFSIRRLIDLTPIDTGRAKASWRVAVNKIDRSVDKRPNRGAQNFNALARLGGSTTSAQIRRAQGAKIGTVLWMTNDLRYIVPLEDGHSPQSRFMLRRTFGEAIAAWPTMVARVRRGAA